MMMTETRDLATSVPIKALRGFVKRLEGYLKEVDDTISPDDFLLINKTVTSATWLTVLLALNQSVLEHNPEWLADITDLAYEKWRTERSVSMVQISRTYQMTQTVIDAYYLHKPKRS